MDIERYRRMERAVWARAGVNVEERRVRLRRQGVEVRVQEIGEGEPVLFLHGAPNAGTTWAPLVAGLRGFRCIVVDRPGAGLSDPLDLDVASVLALGDTIVADVLDGLGIDRAHLVASSFGGFLALRAAAATPERVLAHVQMGCPAFASSMTVPPFMQALLGWRPAMATAEAPVDGREATRHLLRNIGHAKALDDGRLWTEFIDWYTMLGSETSTFAHDGAMLARLGARGSFAPELTPSVTLLQRVMAPTLVFWGADDPFGGPDVGVILARDLPNARLEVLPDGGHLPWLDEPLVAAERTAEFLSLSLAKR